MPQSASTCQSFFSLFNSIRDNFVSRDPFNHLVSSAPTADILLSRTHTVNHAVSRCAARAQLATASSASRIKRSPTTPSPRSTTRSSRAAPSSSSTPRTRKPRRRKQARERQGAPPGAAPGRPGAKSPRRRPTARRLRLLRARRTRPSAPKRRGTLLYVTQPHISLLQASHRLSLIAEEDQGQGR